MLIDTSIWSLLLRRFSARESPALAELERVIRAGRAQLIGMVRQEILTGVRLSSQFEALRLELAAFPDLPMTVDDHVLAAHFANACRKRGIQGSNVDFLLCSVSVREGVPIFTTDRDFELYAQHLPISLHTY